MYFSFVEYHLFYWALLQKRPVILRSLLTEATQYMPFTMLSCSHVRHSPPHICEHMCEITHHTHARAWRYWPRACDKTMPYHTRASSGHFVLGYVRAIHRAFAFTCVTLLSHSHTCDNITHVHVCDTTHHVCVTIPWHATRAGFWHFVRSNLLAIQRAFTFTHVTHSTFLIAHTNFITSYTPTSVTLLFTRVCTCILWQVTRAGFGHSVRGNLQYTALLHSHVWHHSSHSHTRVALPWHVNVCDICRLRALCAR